MRWQEPNPNVGDERVISVFLWLPTTVGTETRWLERANIRQRYRQSYNFASYWDNVTWENR